MNPEIQFSMKESAINSIELNLEWAFSISSHNILELEEEIHVDYTTTMTHKIFQSTLFIT